MDIRNIEREQSKYNTKQIKGIFDKIEEKIKNNVGQLHTAVSNDNKEHSETLAYFSLLDIVLKAKQENWIMNENSNAIMYEGRGSIAAVINDTADVSLYLILKALKTHNKIVLFVEGRLHDVTRNLIKIINSVCEQEKYVTYIDYHEYMDVKEIFDYTDKFETFVFINNPDKYFKFTEKVKDKNTIYTSYGTMSLYLDDENLKDELLKMDEYVFNNNIDLDLIKNVSVQEAVRKINKNLHNYCAVIFTKDTNKAYYFIENIKANLVFVNKNPGREYMLRLDDEVFTSKKEIFI